MYNVSHTLVALFDQLGLESSDSAIEGFIQHHQLDQGISLRRAHFWTKAQRQFIDESWQEDSDWCELIDQLNARLHTQH